MLELLIVLMVGLAMLVAIPLLLLKAVFGFLGFLVMLPFKILGALLQLAAGVGKLVLGVVGLAILVVALPVLIVVVPVALGLGCILIAFKALTLIH